MTKPGVLHLLLSFSLTLILGCEKPAPRTVVMTLDAVNTADKILVVEGETDLPPGARLDAELQDRDGDSILRDQAVVKDGHFFFDFNLERLSEFSSYRVVVTFDPVVAPVGVRYLTGLWGENLRGGGVRTLEDRKVFRQELEVLLSPTAAGRDWEGRNFSDMNVSERARLIEEMERYLTEDPNDKVTKLALARAYLAADSGEYAQGSRAYQLLQDAARSTQNDKNGILARELVAEIEQVEGKRKKEQALAKAQTGIGRYRNDFKILPGDKLGAFRIGAPYREAARYFQFVKPADFRFGQSDQIVVLKDFHNVELTYDPSRRLKKIRTTSPRFRLPEGYGVGSLLQELQTAYGTRVVYSPEYELAGQTEEGYDIYKGQVVTEGLAFEISKVLDPTAIIPSEKVSAITVFRD